MNLKNFFVLIISSFVLVFILIANAFRIRRKHSITILYYHSVPPDLKDKFVWQLETLARYGEVINLESSDSIKLSNHKRKFVITFDDALLSVITNGIPELIKRNMHSIIFVPTRFIGRKPSWGTYKMNNDSKEIVMTNEEIQSLDTNFVTIGSHTVSHLKLSKLLSDQVKSELMDSKNYLESLLSYKIKYLSFPHGDYNSSVLDIAKVAGYEFVFSSGPGTSYLNSSEYVKKRIAVELTDLKIEFVLKILGAYNWTAVISKLKKKIFKSG